MGLAGPHVCAVLRLVAISNRETETPSAVMHEKSVATGRAKIVARATTVVAIISNVPPVPELTKVDFERRTMEFFSVTSQLRMGRSCPTTEAPWPYKNIS